MKIFSYLLCFFCYWAGSVQAGSAWDDDDDVASGFTFLPKPPWQEGAVVLPAYPKDGNLVELDLDARNGRGSNALRYFIDLASLSVGSDDVVRYSAVAHSSSGSRNVFFEGIRCDEQRYRTYAFASASSKKFRESRRSRWRKIDKTRASGYRYELYRYFVCSNELPVAIKLISQALKYNQGEGIDRDDLDSMD